MKKYNYGISALLILMSIWILKEANTLGAAAAGTAMGSGVWPSFLAWAMIILSAALAVQTTIDSLKHKDPEEAEKALKQLNIHDYKVSPCGEIQIYDNVKIQDVMTCLVGAGVNISAINSAEESVEDYYLNLIKEGK